MSPSRQLLFNLVGICLVASVLCVEAHQDLSLNNQIREYAEESNGVPIWPWGKQQKFQCPSSFGAFPDPEDCSFFYVCVAKIATRKQCKRLQQFDKNLRVCVSFLIAVCDDSAKKKTTTQAPNTKETTPGGDNKFTCPSLSGTFMHPTDCTKYYRCTFFIPSLKTCPNSELFDGVKKECKPAKEVHCGSRTKPTDATTIADTTTELTTTTTVEPPTPPPTTNTEAPTPPPTTNTEAPTPPPTTTSEPPAVTTTPKPRVTAPDTDCDEDDLDCIIDDLGENPVWFACDKDIGSYPHPTSRRLFIFCINWKPSVKKCGQDLVFSEELMTCVSPS